MNRLWVGAWELVCQCNRVYALINRDEVAGCLLIDHVPASKTQKFLHTWT